jgi:multiple sugar transport system substrate-binding protein
VLEDLNPYLAKETTIKKSQFYPEIIDRFTIDDKLYVLPRDIAPICVVYYNKKMFDEAGLKYPTDDWTWMDMVKTAKKLVKKDEKGMVTRFGYVDDWPIWEAFVFSNGGKIVDNTKKPKRCVLNMKQSIEGVQFRADLVYKYGITPSPSQMTAMGGMGTADMFMSERVAMFFSGIWKVPMFRQIKNFEWDVVMFPKGPKGYRKYSSGGSGYAITTQCKDKEKAWQVLKRFAGEKGQIDLASQGGLQPAIIKLAESKNFLDDYPPKNKKIMLTATKDIIFTPLMTEWEEINLRYISPELDRVWSGQVTAEFALKKIAKEINRDFFSKKKTKK